MAYGRKEIRNLTNWDYHKEVCLIMSGIINKSPVSIQVFAYRHKAVVSKLHFSRCLKAALRSWRWILWGYPWPTSLGQVWCFIDCISIKLFWEWQAAGRGSQGGPKICKASCSLAQIIFFFFYNLQICLHFTAHGKSLYCPVLMFQWRVA